MELLNIIAILITLSALFSYINYRYIKLPSTIGVMLISLVMSLSLIVLGHLGLLVKNITEVHALMNSIDFSDALLKGMLAFLLFAGALHVNINDLFEKKWEIGILSTLGVAVSTLIIGTVIYFVSPLIGLHLSYIYCLLFGALISPTDPIAIMGIVKRSGLPKSLATKIAGESLFNDGVGVVVFLVILELITGGHEVTATNVLILFAKETIGGILVGLALGLIGYRMLKKVDNYNVEILITLALVLGGYTLALAINTSGPLAIVFAGLLIGNYGRKFAMSEKTRTNLDTFWELVDEILNAVLFVLIGLEVLIITLTNRSLLAGVLAIPIVVLARFVSVGIPVSLLKFFRQFSPHVIKILTWGGLRGGISVALALSIPKGYERDMIVTMTYAVVVFSILIQGLTLKLLIKQ
jgi:CPA1 family monovalent cation:H+ antiporter